MNTPETPDPDLLPAGPGPAADAHAADAESPAAPAGSPEAPAGDLAEIRRVLEAALLVAGEAVPAAQLARLFDPPLDGETVRKLLAEIRADWTGRKVELVQVSSGETLCVPAIASV